MGYSKEHIIGAFTEVSKSHPNKDVSSLWPAVLCHLREEQVYGSQPESQSSLNNLCLITAYTVINIVSFSLFLSFLIICF